MNPKRIKPGLCCFLIFMLISTQWLISTNESRPVKKVEESLLSGSGDKDKPNILIIMADDLGWGDVGFHGGDIFTPRLDSLAKESVELDRFYTNPNSTPTRVGVLTGQHSGRFGLGKYDVTHKMKGGLDPAAKTVAEIFRDEGYHYRACLGKWQLGHSHVKYHPLNQGFSHFYGHYGSMVNYFTHKFKDRIDWHRNFDLCLDEGYSTELIANEAVEYMASVPEDSPFLMYVAFNAPNLPLQAPKEYLELYGYDEQKGPYSSRATEKQDQVEREGQGNTKRQTYQAMVSAMDDAIGQILSALDLLGIADNTIIVFLSDDGASEHGGGRNTPLAGVRGSNQEGSIRGPALIRYPNVIEGGRKISTLSAHIDLLPTLISLSKSESEQEFDGCDLSSVLLGNKPSKDLEDRKLYLNDQLMITERYKLSSDELYDLIDDPKEEKDISAQKKKQTQEMKTWLEKEKAVEIAPALKKGFKLRQGWEMPKN